ncbi:MAG: pyridoxamine 5'-phosphate oxidase-related FMN-binding protein [Ignavibacteriaceae bacterium]|nr:pyridoxamine 5'-phosphate oxidase-related FMN-binding protein [Ignavibacteriaceae bacterium]
MNIKNCIDFANETRVCYLATCEDGQPRVRALGFWFADETGFYFQTGSIKEMYRQLVKNPKVEACFFKQDAAIGKILRVAGAIEFVNDIKLKEQVLNERPFLKEYGLTIDSPALIIFRIPHGQAHFWTMENNLKPKEIIIF